MADERTSQTMSGWADADVFRLIRDTRRTAVLGLASAGKSTFLTSLIDSVHRGEGQSRRSPLGRFIRKVQRLAPYEGEARAFPLEACRGNLRAQEWPEKTVSASEYRLRVSYTGANAAATALAGLVAEERTFLDIPGERVADFAMAGKSYEAWSDALLDEIAHSRPAQAYAGKYLELLRSAESNGVGLSERAVVDSYKLALARFARNLVPLVSPSTFLVYKGEGVEYPRGGEPASYAMSEERLVARGVCGVDRASEFAPLSREVRAAQERLAAVFKERYERYRDAIAEPAAAGFYACEHLLVLVDVAAILEGGPEVYHGTRHALRQVLSYLDPGYSAGRLLADVARRLLSGGRLGVTKVHKIGFVATKADCVHADDRAHLHSLLRQMTEDLVAGAVRDRWLEVGLFYCAAIRATEDLERYPRMRGYLPVDPSDLGAGLAYREFAVSTLPERWPAESEWRKEKYAFAQVWPPRVDLLGPTPFPNIGMEAVRGFVELG